jgi:coenzyme F420-0:L-glutamate ligase/coenzyme F420-1:gamma-L-glutamate ligase
VGEVRDGDDLAALVRRHCALADGDVVAITSKVVSKAEGRARSGSREEALAGETARVVARRGPTAIVRTRHGLTLAAAGIDASNVEPGTHLLLPVDPDATARSVREALAADRGPNVGVIVTDTAGRAWRTGQTDIAIGAAGLRVSESYAGRVDAHGNALVVTEPAVADELAGAAELATGKLGRRPFAVLRGRADLVLPPGEHGPGAVALLRAEASDLFGYGAREAVLRALVGEGGPAFGSPASADELATALREAIPTTDVVVAGDGVAMTVSAPFHEEVWTADVLAFAFGWSLDVETDDLDSVADLRFRRATP